MSTSAVLEEPRSGSLLLPLGDKSTDDRKSVTQAKMRLAVCLDAISDDVAEVSEARRWAKRSEAVEYCRECRPDDFPKRGVGAVFT